MAIQLSVCVLLVVAACGSDLERNRGVTPTARLLLSDGPIYDLGTVEVDAVVDLTLTVTNAGGERATAIEGDFYLSLNFSFADGPYPGNPGTCGRELMPGQSCTMTVRFQPRYEGDHSALVPLTYDDGRTTVQMSGYQIRGRARNLVVE